MFRGIFVIHAKDKPALDRVMEQLRQGLRSDPSVNERFTWLSAASVESPEYCAREAGIFRASGDGRRHDAGDVVGRLDQLPRSLN